MNVVHKIKEINCLLDDIETSDNLSKDKRNTLQREFQDLLTLLNIQQKELCDVKLINIKYEMGLIQAKNQIANNRNMNEVVHTLSIALGEKDDED